MQVIGVLNTKGGVGKTTLTCCLAVEAAGLTLPPAKQSKVAVCDLDPQGSFSDWYRRRGSPDNPALLHGSEFASEAIEALRLTSAYDYVFVDGPPGALTVTEDAIAAADLIVIPIKASGLDLAASQDCIQLCQENNKPFLVVVNDAGQHDGKLVEQARGLLFNWKLEKSVAKQVIRHRVPYVNAVTTGRSGPEKDKAAAEEIVALWTEVKAALRRAGKERT